MIQSTNNLKTKPKPKPKPEYSTKYLLNFLSAPCFCSSYYLQRAFSSLDCSPFPTVSPPSLNGVRQRAKMFHLTKEQRSTSRPALAMQLLGYSEPNPLLFLQIWFRQPAGALPICRTLLASSQRSEAHAWPGISIPGMGTALEGPRRGRCILAEPLQPQAGQSDSSRTLPFGLPVDVSLVELKL